MIGGLGIILWRTSWAVTSTALSILECHAANHPPAKWEHGIRSCECGWRWN